MSFFESYEKLPADPILGLAVAFQNDPRSQKINLGIGSYCDDQGNPYVLKSVRKAEELIFQENLDKEYTFIDGDPAFCGESLKLFFGKDHPRLGDIYGVQTIGATGALRVGAELLKDGKRKAYVADPTWPNHPGLLKRTGYQVETYPYYDPVKKEISFDALCAALEKMPEGSLVLMQGPCHNPTGCDFAEDQIKVLGELFKKHRLIPFFDMAYIGFADSFEKDCFAVRYLASIGLEFLAAFSYSKNMGLYGERVGLLAFVTNGKELSEKVATHVRAIIRTLYSTPPLHSERIVNKILQTKELTTLWKEELDFMCRRIHKMRVALADGLSARLGGRDMEFLKKQRGMFSFLGITPEAVSILNKQYGIYMPTSGRINVAGLTPDNMEYVVSAVASVMK